MGAPMVKVLVTGAGGQLGHALSTRLGEERVMSKAREALDITDLAKVREWLPVLRPDLVVNCAAFTDAEQAERDRQQCWRVNTEAVHNLVQTCNQAAVPLMHISSSAVFGQDETRRKPYAEDDAPGPVNYQAMTKAMGESAIINATRGCSPDGGWFDCGGWWIIRTTMLYEKPWRPYRNFPQLLLSRPTNSRKPLPLADDVEVTPTYVPHLVTALMHIIDNFNDFPWGVYHIANTGGTSLFGLGQKIAAHCKRGVYVTETTRDKYFPSIGRNPKLVPAFTGLNTDKIYNQSNIRLPSWEEGVEQFCRDWNRQHS